MLRGNKSRTEHLISGVPQGSVLGPLLFLVFIGDMTDGVNASILLYVDDSKAKMRVNDEEDVETFQNELDKVYKWEEDNNMKFNGDKFLVLRYGNRNKNNELHESTNYFTSNMAEIITQVDSCRDLGVTMEDNASFEKQIEKVCNNIKQKCG